MDEIISEIKNYKPVNKNDDQQAIFYENHSLALKDLRSEFESVLIELAIQSTGVNKTYAARVLGIGKATLHCKIEGLNI